MPSAGEMKDRITLVAPGGLDTWGQPTTGATTEVWAAVASVKQADRPAGSAVVSESTLTATLRWRDGITTAWKVIHRGTTYNVAAMETQYRQWTVLYLARR